MKATLIFFVFAFPAFPLIVRFRFQPLSATLTNWAIIAELPTRVVRAPEPAGIQPESKPVSDQLLSRISFEKTVCDLGDVGQGTRNSCEFRFTNTGQGLLKIGKISRTCGCTVFHLDKKEYTPNTMSLKINPYLFTGQRFDTETVLLNKV